MKGVMEFLEMGGYALYVWGSFGVTALLMIAEPLMLRSRRKAVLKRVARIARLHVAEVKQ
jgi:heme exporter protein D